VALNSPVVTLDSLPPGPASAAVALHEAGASLCVRSVRTGQARFFATTQELAAERRVALDAALSFAESMGFLFDEDEVGARGDAGAGEAAALWRELCGEGVGPRETAEPEILLDTPVPEPRPVPPALMLSKFRRVGGAAPEPAAEAVSPPDVRLRLVSRF
jgi:hypothetical protein